VRSRLATVLWAEPAPVEVLSGLFVATVGGWLMVPAVNTFATPAFAGFRNLNESAVGGLMLTLGLAAVLVAFWPAQERIRAGLAFVMVGLYAFWTMFAYQGNPAGTGWIAWAVLALGPTWVAVRLGVERHRG